MKCAECGKSPSEILEYVEGAKENGYASADEFVRKEEGTFNPRCGLFWCTECYVSIGMPLGMPHNQEMK